MNIALATDETWPDLDPDSVPLIHALARRGARAEPAVWSDTSVAWDAYDAIMLRSVWDYVHRVDEFLAWVVSVPVRLFNPPAVVAWNVHKSYLRDLADAGVPVVDTVWVPPGEAKHVEWHDGIVKPAVAGSALGLERVGAGDRVQATKTELLVQPFLPAIQTEGELSLLYAASEFSHAVRKTPTEGDFRVQTEFGGSTIRAEPSQQALAIAEAALEAVGEPLVYARVDVVRAPDDELKLIELELIEPSLFLLEEPAAPDRFAGALLSAVAASGPSP